MAEKNGYEEPMIDGKVGLDELVEYYNAMKRFVVPNDARFCSDFCPNWMAEERGEELRPSCTMFHVTLMGSMEKAVRCEPCKKWFK